jgi:uncharacterized protein YcbK (DUF882 family)
MAREDRAINLEHFKLDEFKCKCGCGRHVDKMNEDFMLCLDHARELAGEPFRITSGYRCPTYNLSIGGVHNSAHTKGLAADIATGGSRSRFVILKALLTMGFTRIGIGQSFIHVDMDDSKPQLVAWDYYTE